MHRIILLSLISLCAFLAGFSAFAAAPEPWQLGMQAAATPVKAEINEFNNLLMVVMTGITLLVLALILFICLRFREKANPTPSKTTHNTKLEVIWTAIPVIILVILAVPSFRLIYLEDVIPEAEMTVKVVGYQWYWGYEYPDHGDIKFDSYLINDEDLQQGQKRLLDVDNRLVVPVDTTIRVQVTSSDVIHSWFVPSMGVQIYAIPGRLNETWMRIEKPGVYYGQCNQICGVRHGFMPIVIEALPKQEFEAWTKQAKEKFATIYRNQNMASLQLASIE